MANDNQSLIETLTLFEKNASDGHFFILGFLIFSYWNSSGSNVFNFDGPVLQITPADFCPFLVDVTT